VQKAAPPYFLVLCPLISLRPTRPARREAPSRRVMSCVTWSRGRQLSGIRSTGKSLPPEHEPRACSSTGRTARPYPKAQGVRAFVEKLISARPGVRPEQPPPRHPMMQDRRLVDEDQEFTGPDGRPEAVRRDRPAVRRPGRRVHPDHQDQRLPDRRRREHRGAPAADRGVGPDRAPPADRRPAEEAERAPPAVRRRAAKKGPRRRQGDRRDGDRPRHRRPTRGPGRRAAGWRRAGLSDEAEVDAPGLRVRPPSEHAKRAESGSPAPPDSFRVKR
jgi:hypothetical protein